MRNTGKRFRSGAKSSQEVQKDRKSGTGINGLPKKGGHGGKFTWSGDGYYSFAELEGFHGASVDVKDPNFEDTNEIVAAAAGGYSTA